MKLPKNYALSTKKLKVDLSLSENPLGCSPASLVAIKNKLSTISTYPDPNCSELEKTISKKLKIPQKKIILGNGSESLIDLVCLAVLKPGDEVVLPQTTFPLFERSIILFGGKPVFAKMGKNLGIDIEKIRKKVASKTRLIILCNPNNPTGQVISPSELAKFIKSVSSLLVLVDEANIEFGGKSIVNQVRSFSSLLVLRTFSKGFGLAGLRIGFLVGPEKIVKKIRKIQQPFAVNTLALEAALAAFADQKFIARSKEFMDRERKFLTRELTKRGFKVFPSESNNLLVKTGSSSLIRFLEKNQVSVVRGEFFRGLDNRFFRLSPRLIKTNKKFLKIVDKFIKKS